MNRMLLVAPVNYTFLSVDFDYHKLLPHVAPFCKLDGGDDSKVIWRKGQVKRPYTSHRAEGYKFTVSDSRSWTIGASP